VSDARAYLLERSALVDAALDASLPSAEEPPARLHAAMRHLVFPGGKRLRPVLALAGAEALGAAPELALPAAVAVELVHTYSLVHDDLPCMDDDPQRRGRPSVHVAFGEATAVLAGDALLTLAFEVLASDRPGASPAERGPGPMAERRLAAAGELARAAGSRALVGGQADDLALGAAEADAQRIESIHRRKTAALIAASISCGALLAGGGRDEVGRLRRFGGAVGVAFQIADDLLDAGSDDGCSLVRVLGADAARERGEELLALALREIAPLGGAAEPLRALALFALRRKE
jgi:geranylgeranyl diphosphate synthase type II